MEEKPLNIFGSNEEHVKVTQHQLVFFSISNIISTFKNKF